MILYFKLSIEIIAELLFQNFNNNFIISYTNSFFNYYQSKPTTCTKFAHLIYPEVAPQI